MLIVEASSCDHPTIMICGHMIRGRSERCRDRRIAVLMAAASCDPGCCIMFGVECHLSPPLNYYGNTLY